MVMLLIPAVFLFGIAIGLFFLAIIGVVLMLVLRILMGILWIAIKILEHRERRKAEPEILTIIEEEERPTPMKDVTPRQSTRQLKAIVQR